MGVRRTLSSRATAFAVGEASMAAKVDPSQMADLATHIVGPIKGMTPENGTYANRPLGLAKKSVVEPEAEFV
jgi:hypothetical protein